MAEARVHSAEQADGEHCDRDGSRDGESGAQTNVDRDRTEQDPEMPPKNSERKVSSYGFFCWGNVRLEGPVPSLALPDQPKVASSKSAAL